MTVTLHPRAADELLAAAGFYEHDGFPFDRVYRMREDRLEMLAIAHHRRRPGYWKTRA